MNRSLTKKYLIEILLIVAVVCLDIVSKIFLFGKEFDLIPSILGVRYVGHLNTGGAWGFLGSSMWLLILFTLVFLAVVIFVEIRFGLRHPLYIISLSLVVGGAVGNLIDRLFLGGVRDFLYFEFWPTYPTFNLADVSLVIGMILLAIFVLFIMKVGDKKESKL